MTRHYLDHASTSPARPEVVEAMVAMLGVAGDPGRVHTEGRQVRMAVEEARERVASLLGCRSREVVFTSGATEAITTANWGAASRGRHMVCPAVEHSAVREAAARHGDVTTVGVDVHGRVDPQEVATAIRPGDTSLVHIQLANHEVGTVQPVAEVVAACRQRDPHVLVHVDAAAVAGHVPVDFPGLGADLLSVSAHKLGGPQGVGALVVRRGLRLRPLMVGGEQERARRAGMENVAAIVGFGAAASALDGGTLEAEAADARRRAEVLLRRALEVEDVVSYGDTMNRLPHIACLGIGGVEAEPVLLALDQADIAVHSGSSCSSESLEPSPVLAAMGFDAERSLRISVGWSTTDDDIEAFTRAFPEVVARLRSLRSG